MQASPAIQRHQILTGRQHRQAQTGDTGLGLSITRELINRMGGSVGFSSVPDQGALFWLEVPLDQADLSISRTT